MKYTRTCSIALAAWFLIAVAVAEEIPIILKETARVGATAWPVTVVVPLPESQYHNTASFSVSDGTEPVPAQFEALTKYWGRDNSIRHMIVQFQSDIGAAGKKSYFIRDTGGGTAPPRPVEVIHCVGRAQPDPACPDPAYILVKTGEIQFTIKEVAFNILDTVWYDLDDDGSYEVTERIILPSSNHGGRYDGCTDVGGGSCTRDYQHDSGLAVPTCTVEESGPMRAAVKCATPTLYNDLNSDGDADDAGEYHRHGYGVRIYAYAGRSDIRIDYQLRNGAKGPSLDNGKWADPLYFNSLSLEWDLELSGTVTVTTSDPRDSGDEVDRVTLDGNGVELAQTLHDKYQIRRANGTSAWVDRTDASQSLGFLDASDSSWGVTAMVRHFWETWPNGVEIQGTTGPTLQVQLWPDWSRQYNRFCSENRTKICDNNSECSGTCEYGFTTSNLYWLEDMQYTYKTVALNFHGSSMTTAGMKNWAKTIHHHPVPVVDMAYQDTAATTLDHEGKNPRTSRFGSDTLQYSYPSNQLDETNSGTYHFGWDVWHVPSVGRMGVGSTCEGGNVPFTVEYFYATESPDDYWYAEMTAIGELNVQPQWMDEAYTYANDWSTMKLEEGHYCGGYWRDQGDTADYPIPGTGKSSGARDNQHAWLYHVEEAYYLTANPWIRDWYAWIAEFRKPEFAGDEIECNMERCWGHSMENAMQAFRVTGDTDTLDKLEYFLSDIRLPTLNLQCGHVGGSKGSAYQFGFLEKALVEQMKVWKHYDWQAWAYAFQWFSASIEWNYHYGRYGYNVNGSEGTNPCTVGTSSSGTAQTLPDSESWYYWNTGKSAYKTRIDDYVDGGYGIDGLTPLCTDARVRSPADDCWDTSGGKTWEGDWQGRNWHWVQRQSRNDTTPPIAISNLTASLGGTTLTLSWTSPDDAAYYYIVWADRMISEAHQTNTNDHRNWWAATPSACDAITCDGSATIAGVTADPVYATVFVFDSADNMSAISNVATSSAGPVEKPSSPTNLRVK